MKNNPALIFMSARLSHRQPTPFDWIPDTGTTDEIRQFLDLLGIARLRFWGALHPDGADDFRLEARLVADVTQSCVITLAPVRTRIDVAIVQRYLADWPHDTESERELPEEDMEPLPYFFDIPALAREALTLALPDYPRATGVELADATFATQDISLSGHEDEKPLAGLARYLQQPEAKDVPDDSGD